MDVAELTPDRSANLGPVISWAHFRSPCELRNNPQKCDGHHSYWQGADLASNRDQEAPMRKYSGLALAAAIAASRGALEPLSELRAAVERWAAQQPDKPTLAEAVRHLIEDGFATD